MAAGHISDFEREVSNLLEVSSKDEIIQYALTFQNKRDVLDYLKDILQEKFSQKQAAVNRCLKSWKPPSLRADENGDSIMCQITKPKSTGKNDVGKRKEGNDNAMKGNVQRMTVDDFAFSNPKMKEPSTPPHNQRQFLGTEREQAKKKSPRKFVPLYSEGKSLADEIMLLPGRHICECAAQKHKLISNCLNCGKIVCQQEGSGPCLFCGNLVCTGEEQEILSRNSRTSEKLYRKLMDKGKEVDMKGLEEAKALKDKLVGFDRTSARRTKVIDDQADYFSAESKWLSKQQRKEAQKKEDTMMDKKHQSRRDRKYVLDFAGREVREDKSNDAFLNPEDFDSHVENVPQNDVSLPKNMIDPSIKMAAPVFVQTAEFDNAFANVAKSNSEPRSKSLRLQDGELQKISDKGMCLSMHQPLAGLLVRGIKKVEGRCWYSAHRGRLWIASTVKVPEPDQIQAAENFYRAISDGNLEFPESYPSAALLGCVDIVDCLAQDEYRKQGDVTDESTSEYVFICENPQELFLKLPVKGKHKIWKLDPQIHKAAKTGIFQ